MRYKASPDCEVCAFGDGAAVLDLRSNSYFSLNESGRLVFDLLSEPREESEIVGRVSEHYGVDPAVCGPDVSRLLDDLVSNRLAVPA